MAATGVDMSMAAAMALVVAAAMFILPDSQALFSFDLVRRGDKTVNRGRRGGGEKR